MLIRMFVKSHSSDESKKICERILIKLEKYIDEKSYLNNQSYWKMDNVFLLEICINLKEKISLGILEKFALSISDKWQVTIQVVMMTIV